MPAGVKSRLERIDQAQQRRPALAVALATVKKFGEDKSSNLASMIAFWAFFSIFPLMLAAITVLSWVLPEGERERVLEQVASYMPLLDVSTIGKLDGSVLALAIGLGAALWSGSAVVRVAQEAFNAVWEVPKVERPKLVEQIKRSILVMMTIGVGLVASTFTIGFVSGDNPALDLGPLSRLLGYGLAIAVDIGLFIVAFRLLTDRALSTRDVLPGAVLSGVAFWVLQTASSIIITRHLTSAQDTYGNFATVITILWWFYLQAQITLLGAQLNVVLKRRYWPRGLVDPPETDADYRLLADYAREQTYVEEQDVDVRVPVQGGARRPIPPTDVSDEEDPAGAGRRPAPARHRRPDPREQTLADLVQGLSEDTRRLVRDELALAKLELQEKGRSAGKGAGMLAAAGVVALYATAALVTGAVLGVATALGWVAGAVTGVVLLAVTAALGLVGRKHISQVGNPAPQLALDEFKADLAVVKERIHR
jgi:membrane protein